MRAFVTSPAGMASLLAAALVALYLALTYGAYLAVLAPFAMLLVCPLMMLFMMRGHNRGPAGNGGHSMHAGCHGVAPTEPRQSTTGEERAPVGGEAHGRNSD